MIDENFSKKLKDKNISEGDVLKIIGGVPLEGKIKVRGAKNLVSKAMVAALLSEKPSQLYNVPDVRDVKVVSKLLKIHGAEVNFDSTKGIVGIEPPSLTLPEQQEVAKVSGSSRIPILFCGPLLHRLGKAFIPSLGGDEIGKRPVNFHINALKEFGATITKETPYGFEIQAPDGGLCGAKIHLPFPSVGATEQTILTAVLAKGITSLSNAAIEPEIIDLISLLQKMGAIISVDTDRIINIEGVESLRGYNHISIPDRIESASWASLALATKGSIFVEGITQELMSTYLNVFRKIGGEFDVCDEGIRFYHNGTPLKPIALETNVHPGFMTDWQQPIVIVLTQAEGVSIIHETVYENRFQFISPLKRMGANVQLYRECLGSTACRFGAKNFEHSIAIFGRTPLKGTDFIVPDIRGGFSHVIAALTASGKSNVYGVKLFDRGYEKFREKLLNIGAQIDNTI